MEPTLVDQEQMKQWCEHHMHRYVLAQTHDGWCADGIHYPRRRFIREIFPLGCAASFVSNALLLRHAPEKAGGMRIPAAVFLGDWTSTRKFGMIRKG
ncbi:hypothetical protein [Candidatus Pristimantibacillus sp. PTI5]|uniref:hypothetical protein n=1 Tax=Candidatus Pristimantibacillus sp. PTI5 TaxID=3400422 RepID=UPI003B017725